MSEFRDYDAAVGEIEDRWFEFRFGGEDFKANLNIDGALILRWMADTRSMSNVVALLAALLGGDDYKRLLATGQPWAKYEALIVDIFSQLGGPGNALDEA